MAVKLRMQRHGAKKRPFYFIVAANSTAPRDGKFIEKLGTYNPLTVPATIHLDGDKALAWLQKGAQPTHTVRRILSFKGVLYKKHLLRGVSLGLFDEAAAEEKFSKWMVEHEALVAKRQEASRKSKQEKRHAISQESVRRIEEKNSARKAEEEKEKAEAEAAVAAEPVETVEEVPQAEATTEEAAETEAQAPAEEKKEETTDAPADEGKEEA